MEIRLKMNGFPPPVDACRTGNKFNRHFIPNVLPFLVGLIDTTPGKKFQHFFEKNKKRGKIYGTGNSTILGECKDFRQVFAID
jgi:hypothetical protein